MMGDTQHYDLIVLGAGSGGVRAARLAGGQHGAKVAIIEARFLGGTCVNVGCVPKKLMVHAAHGQEYMALMRSFGWQGDDFTFDLARLKENRDAEIQRLNGIYERLLGNNNVDIYRGYGVLCPQSAQDKAQNIGHVKVGTQVLSANKILIATGSTPFIPDIEGRDLVHHSDAMFDLEQIPQKALIVGGGYIAIEMACILQALGADTTLSYRGAHILKDTDKASAAFLQQQCAEHLGLHVKTHDTIQKITKNAKNLSAHHSDGAVEYDFILYATGRVPYLDTVAMQQLGIAQDAKGFIKVTDSFQTTNPVYYALGDIINSPALTPVAIREAMFFIDSIFNNTVKKLPYHYTPTAIFSIPTYAYVGENEQSLQAKNISYNVYETSFKPLAHSLGGSNGKILMRLYTDKKTDKLLGFHQVGGAAEEVIQLAAACLQAGMSKAQLNEVIPIHPSSAEEWVTL